MRIKKIRNILVYFAFIISLFLILELFVRITLHNKQLAYKNGKTKDEIIQNVIDYHFPKNNEKTDYYTKVDLNKHGLRDYEFNLSKRENVTRIAVVGDSFTYGLGLENLNDTYPKKLQAIMNNQSNRNYEVINFGMPSLNTLDIYYVIEKKVMPFNPDIIIYGYVDNDPQFNENEYHVPMEYCFDKPFYYTPSWVAQKAHNIKTKYIEGRNEASQYMKFTEFAHTDNFIGWQCVQNTFKKIEKNYLDRNDITFIVFNFPTLYSFDENSWISTHIENKLNKTLENSQIVFLPFATDFWNKTDRIDKKYLYVKYPIDSHYSGLGNEIAAEVLYNKMTEENLIQNN